MTTSITTQKCLKDAKTIIIKIGTALIVDKSGDHVRQEWLDALAEDVKALREAGKNIVIVSSGAVALGRTSLGIPLDKPPMAIALQKKQASSAIGQFHVFNGFFNAFTPHNIKIAQVLLTMSETENRRMHLNARATMNELIENGVIPIINENDTISTGEIRFGDNDRLAARVAQMIEADVVVLLSTTDGLYTANPDKDDSAEHIPVVEDITQDHIDMAGEAIPGMSTGGMKSKLEAAQNATTSGIDLIISNGRGNHILDQLVNDENIRSTLFVGDHTTHNAKKRWIGAHMRPKGKVFIDDGAIQALKKGGSLLPVGVKKIEGRFERGDILEICTESGHKLGMGITAFNKNDADHVIGKNSEQIAEVMGFMGRSELIHRNDMVLQA
ncbi:MAG: glutamate 5-kinase [Alphaproteobacteria bacterium]|nr:glutamate 5-kinase [Alphaproteobacteria bacterium]